jgi:hypothetical protein
MQNDSWASSWPATLQPLCLGREPKVKVATISMFISIKISTQHGILIFLNNTLLLNITPQSLLTNSMFWFFYFIFAKLMFDKLITLIILSYLLSHTSGRWFTLIDHW